MICLLSAMEEELIPFREALEHSSETQASGRLWHRGTLEGHEVVLGVTGVGKVMAASACQTALDVFHPEKVLFTGIAGAFHPEFSRGDLLVARDCLQYDLDLSLFGFSPDQIDSEELGLFPGDPKMLEAAERFRPREYNIRFGRILTADIFLTPKLLPLWSDRIAALKGDAVDMEGAAAALPAYLSKIPYLLVRSISDQVRSGPVKGFRGIVKQGSGRCLDLVRWILHRP